MKNKGFTLIELLVVIGIFALILSGTVGLFSMIVKNKLRTKEILEVRRQGGNAVSVINREITGAKNVSNVEVNFISLTGLEDDTISIQCDEEIETILINGDNFLIDDDKLEIENCKFNSSQNIKGNYSVDFSFSLKSKNSDKWEVFRTFAVTRNVIN